MSRIPPLAPEDARRAAVEAGIPEGMADLNVFRVLLHHPTVAKPVHELLSTLLWSGELDPRLRELAILRIGWRTGAVYEWTHHWGVAKICGLTEGEMLATRDPAKWADLTEAERAVLEATDETLDRGAISADTWARLAAHLGPRELIELVAAIGNWRLFAELLRSLEIDLEDGTDPWPPDGDGPPDGRGP